MPNPQWPSSLVPLLEDWKEELRLGRQIIRTRETFGVSQWTDRPRLMCAGSMILDSAKLAIWEQFLADINLGNSAFGFWSFHRHPLLYNASSPYVAALSRHRYDASPVTPGWHVGWENLLESSENLGDTTQWKSFGGATVTRTGGQSAPDGSATAWRIQTSGGTAQTKLYNDAYAVQPVPSGWKYYCSIWAKNLSPVPCNIWLYYVGVVLRLNPGQEWTYASKYGTMIGGSVMGVSVYADSAADNLDILIWHPMIIGFGPDGGPVPSREWGDALGYLPTPTGSYIAGDPYGRAYVWRESGAPTSGVIAGKIYAENALLLAEQGEELIISKERLSADAYKLRLLIGEV